MSWPQEAVLERLVTDPRLDFTVLDLAEALWLAIHVDLGARPQDGPRTAPDPGEPADSHSPTEAEAVDLRLPGDADACGADRGVTAEPEPIPPDPPAGSSPSLAGPRELPAIPRNQGLGWGSGPQLPVVLPTAPALPARLDLARAMRPLRRRVPSPHRRQLDVDQTARMAAAGELWFPIWKPEPDRWLDATILLDQRPGDDLWGRLGVELATLLAELGAFRVLRVRRVRLDRGIRLGEVAGAADRHLMLVVSDCVGDAWRTGAAGALLHGWARRAAVAILQPLPECLWHRTALAPQFGRLWAPRPGAPTTAYVFRSDDEVDAQVAPGAVAIPILEIDPDWLRAWAGWVAGTTSPAATGKIDAFVTVARLESGAPEPTGTSREYSQHVERAERMRPGTARDLVDEFRGDASPQAYTLARYLAPAVPLNLGVIRAVQAATLPESVPSHVAEVLYSGLLEQVVDLGADQRSDERQYDFVPGVRDLLLATLPNDQALWVFEAVSRYLEQRVDQPGASFRAVAFTPARSLSGPALREPFARVRAQVLRRLTSRTMTVAVGCGPGVDPLAGESGAYLVGRIAEVYRLRVPGVVLTEHHWSGESSLPDADLAPLERGYLLWWSGTRPGQGLPRCVGACAGPATQIAVRRFVETLRHRLPRAFHGQNPILVTAEDPDESARDWADHEGVVLMGFPELQLDGGPRQFARWQAADLARDPVCPTHRYIPQRWVSLPWDQRSALRAGDSGQRDALRQLRTWLNDAQRRGQVIGVVGESGLGKTVLLRQLARRLAAEGDPVVPVLVDLGTLDERRGLDQAVMSRWRLCGEETTSLALIRHLLREGRLVPLCDGLDEWVASRRDGAIRTRWNVVRDLVAQGGTIVVVSRDRDLLAEIMEATADLALVRRRMVMLECFDREQKLRYLQALLGGRQPALARLGLLEGVGNLGGMAANPRFLALMASIDDRRLRSVGRGAGAVTAAMIYRELIDQWLENEHQRQRAFGNASMTKDMLWRAVTALAMRLWESGASALTADDLGVVADVLIRITATPPAQRPTRSDTARALAAGGLLVRDHEYRFAFVDRTVMEWLVAQALAERPRHARPEETSGPFPETAMTSTMVEELPEPGTS